MSVTLLALVAQAAVAQGQVDVLCGVAVPWCESLADAFQMETGIAVNITLKDATDQPTFEPIAGQQPGEHGLDGGRPIGQLRRLA